MDVRVWWLMLVGLPGQCKSCLRVRDSLQAITQEPQARIIAWDFANVGLQLEVKN